MNKGLDFYSCKLPISLDITLAKSRVAEEELMRDIVELRMFGRKGKGHGSGEGKGESGGEKATD